MTEEHAEGTLDAMLAHHPLEVAVFAAGGGKELAIRAGGVPVDGGPGQGEEVCSAFGEAPSQDVTSALGREPATEEGRKLP